MTKNARPSKAKLLVIVLVLICLLFFPVKSLASSLYGLDNRGLLDKPTLPPKTVVLTFDDGPSQYTSQIAKILKAKHVKATFFVVGREALKYDLLKSLYDDGFEIGNHTYSHPDLATLPPWHVQLELNLARLVIESKTKHSTRLFRPPFLGSDSLSSQSQNFIAQIGQYGYLTAGEDVDSQDWRKPGVEKIVQNATSHSSGGIILLHDGGGDRRQTVESLPEIIDYYTKHGYRFMTIGEALGFPREQLMPATSPNGKLMSTFAAAFFETYTGIKRALYWLVLTLIAASFGRMALVVTAALVQFRRRFPDPPAKDLPVSILVPAYNEAAVIASCLKSILASDYRHFEVIVVDDGSKDDTAKLARALKDSRLKVVSKTNGGKASALNHGIEIARADFIVAIDADTVFRPDTLRKLMRHFQNPKVGAVSGNTRVANRHKLITKLQSLEYVVGFNLDRRMGDLFDCITVVPGAIGAFRKSALARTGGFTFDTLAEDTDLTLSVKEAGYRIVYDAAAVAYTEAPSTIKDLLKQRFRWTFGTMQAVWKHKYAILNPRYRTLGLIGLPYLLFYQILFPLLSPLFDAVVVVGLINHQFHLMLVSFIVYTGADVIMSGVALKLDGEKLRQLWLIVPQRIIYRQLMYYVIIKSAANVLRGRLVGWGSLKREGKHLKQI